MLIVGHRGARSVAPENTIKGIRAGIKCADYIEIDVRLTHDHVPVIIHDARLDRTTSGTGQVNDHRMDELRGLDAGDGEKLPTLAEALTEVLSGGRGVFLEIKEPGSEEIICENIRNLPLENIVVVSFHPESLDYIKTRLPSIKTGIVVPHAQGRPNHIDENWFRFDFILPRRDFFTIELVKRAHVSGLQVIPWTLNTAGEIKKAIKTGVEGFVSDDPCNAIHILETMK